MNEEQLAGLHAKMQRLERSNRVLLGLATLALFVGAISCGAGSSDRLSARRIDVIDEKGQVRATLSADAKGGLLVLDDGAGKPRVSLSAWAERSGLELFGDAVKEPVAAFTWEPGGTSLALADGAGRRRVSLGFFDQMGWLAFFDGKDNPTYTVPPQK